MYRELCYYSWTYDVSPPLLSCNVLSFPFEVILSDRVFKDLRTLDVCLACAYLCFVLFYYRLLNISIRKDNFEVVSYPTIIFSFVLFY